MGANPGFMLQYRNDGVFLEIQPSASPMNPAYAVALLVHKGIEGFDAREVTAAVRKGDARVRVASPQNEKQVNGSVYVEVAEDEMTATLQALPADEGKRSAIMLQAVEALRSERVGVMHGLDEVALQAALDDAQLQKHVVARGTPARDGVDGAVRLHFEQSRSNAPKVLEDGRVDYRDLNLFTTVTEGQVLVTLTPAVPAQDGMTVRGKPLASRKAKEVHMPTGSNVRVSEDGLTMTAARNGRVDLLKGRVIVSDYYEVNGNVDMSTGNIDFVGDVIVRGNVIAGMTVTAGGNIEVYGIVEAATLKAGGNIILYKGMQGMDKGELRCEGDLVARFIERARVSAVGKVTADAVLHSHVDSGQALCVTGARGALVGGMVRSGEMVVARVAGAVSQTNTVIEVGVNPVHRERQRTLTQQIERMPFEIYKVERLLKNMAADPTEANKALAIKLVASHKHMTQQIEACREELAELESAMAQAVKGRVHVLGRVYPGVKLVIGTISLTIKAPVDFTTFKARDGEIAFVSCEYSA